MKAGFVSLVGRPNAGKSTLLNYLVGQKLAIVSDKPQTTRNRIVVTAGDAILWNGHEVTAQTLSGLLAETRRFAVEPELQFEPDPAASYNATAHVIHVIKASGVTKFGFVGNERFRDLAA